MPTRILGISAYYHDSAACLVEDGRIVAAAQEERFTRRKHDASFPSHAVDYCLREAGIAASELALAGFYEKPLVKFDRLLETYTACAPRGWKSYLMAMPLWLSEKLWMADDLKSRIAGYEGEVMFGEHHESHAASAFYPSPFEEAAIVTIDGVGAVLLVLGLVYPPLLKWPSAAWWRLAHALAYVNARVLLTVLFAIVLVPISVVWRLTGKDPLARRRSAWPGWSPHPARYRDKHHYSRMY